jgi:hypothetical protein
MILLRFALTFAVSLAYSTLFAQTNSPIPLNEHFFEINPSDSLHHRYNKIVSFTSDSVKIERMFTLENKLIRIERTHPKDPEYREYSIEKYALDGAMIEKTTVNLANTKFISTYYHENKQVGQVMYRGESKYRVFRNGYPEPRESLYNDFIPNPIESKKVFSSFISEKVKFYPSEFPIYSQQIWIALLIDESGKMAKIEWANPLGCEERLVERYLKAIRDWKDGFTPALDHLGNPKSQWFYVDFHVGSPKN